jgi:lipopolysaccharide transport system permease protein
MKTSSKQRNLDSTSVVSIKGSGFSWSLNTRELFKHRELLFFLTWRDIKVRYKQTVLGLAWVVLQPLAIAFTLSLFLGRLSKMPSDGMPYIVFAYTGMVVWQLFANALTGSSDSLLANGQLITKVYFPRLIVPLSAVLASILDFAISLFVLAIFLAYFRLAPTARLTILPLLVLQTVVIALGVGLWLAALNVKYRDVRYTLGFLVQFWFFATPIAYPTSVVPDRWKLWYSLNPMVGVVEGFRWALRGTGSAPFLLLSVSSCVAVLLLLSGLYYFRRMEDTFADFI